MTVESGANRIAEPAIRDPREALLVEQIVLAHQRRIRGFIRVRALRDGDVDEILNDTWLRLWKFFPRVDRSRLQHDMGGIAPLLYSIALSALVDYYRKHDNRVGRRLVFLEELRNEASGTDHSGLGIDSFDSFLRDQKPSPEESYSDWERKERVLRVAFGATGRPPHEVLVFGLTVCLGYKPQEVTGDSMAGRSLSEIEQELEEGISETAFLPDTVLEGIFSQLRQAMHWSTDRVEDSLVHPAAPTIGETLLTDYYRHPEDPCEDVRIWRHNVVRRTVLLAREEADPHPVLFKQKPSRSGKMAVSP